MEMHQFGMECAAGREAFKRDFLIFSILKVFATDIQPATRLGMFVVSLPRVPFGNPGLQIVNRYAVLETSENIYIAGASGEELLNLLL